MSKAPTRNAEQNEILGAFVNLLEGPTGDGGVKRAAGIKPNWKDDDSHEAAAYRHISYWQNGEMVDKDSGCHPLAHAAWRLLAVAYQETQAAREAEPDDEVKTSGGPQDAFYELTGQPATCDSPDCDCCFPTTSPTPVDDIQAIADSIGGQVITVNVDDILLGWNLEGIPQSVVVLAKTYLRQLIDAGRSPLPVTLQVLYRS